MARVAAQLRHVTMRDVATVRELEPAVVRAFSRSGDALGLGQVPLPNVAPDDVLELDGGDVGRVVDVVHAVPARRSGRSSR